MHKYETLKEAVRYTEANLDNLDRHSGWAARRIARKVEECISDNQPCGLAICQVCGRDLRIMMAKWFEAQRQLWPGHSHQVTILNRLITSEELSQIDVEHEHRQIRQQLRRGGFEAVAIGGTELSWRRAQCRWMLHHHLVLFGSTTEDLKVVRALTIGEECDRKVGIRSIMADTFDKAASYSLKFGLTQRLGRSMSGRCSRIVPLPKLQAGELAAFFAARKASEFVLLVGLRRRGDRLERSI